MQMMFIGFFYGKLESTSSVSCNRCLFFSPFEVSMLDV